MHHYEYRLLGHISKSILEATKCVRFMLHVMGVRILYSLPSVVSEEHPAKAKKRFVKRELSSDLLFKKVNFQLLLFFKVLLKIKLLNILLKIFELFKEQKL